MINRVAAVKYLGIYLDDKLKFDKRISELNNSLTKTINDFKIMKNYIPLKSEKSTVFCLCIVMNSMWYRNLPQHKYLTNSKKGKLNKTQH